MLNKKVVKYFLKSGGIFTSWQPHWIAMVLGSAVGVCVYDPILKIGGVSHFMYPKNKNGVNDANFGEYSIPKMLDMMRELGTNTERLRAHILGGAHSPVFSTKNIGRKNIMLAKKYLKKNKINIVNDDTGGYFGRKILFNTHNGEILVYKANRIRMQDWYGDKSIDNR